MIIRFGNIKVGELKPFNPGEAEELQKRGVLIIYIAGIGKDTADANLNVHCGNYMVTHITWLSDNYESAWKFAHEYMLKRTEELKAKDHDRT